MMKATVEVTGQRIVSFSKDQALEVLHDIRTLARYEPKVTWIEAQPQSPEHGTYDVRGRFASLPWSGRFSYALNPNGFTSEMLSGPLGVKRVRGGFSVKAISETQSRISHFETYELWPVILPLLPLVRIYLRRAMEEELRNVEAILSERSTRSPSLPSDEPSTHKTAPDRSVTPR